MDKSYCHKNTSKSNHSYLTFEIPGSIITVDAFLVFRLKYTLMDIIAQMGRALYYQFVAMRNKNYSFIQPSYLDHTITTQTQHRQRRANTLLNASRLLIPRLKTEEIIKQPSVEAVRHSNQRDAKSNASFMLPRIKTNLGGLENPYTNNQRMTQIHQTIPVRIGFHSPNNPPQNPSELVNQIIKAEYTLDSLYRSLGGSPNTLTPARIYLYMIQKSGPWSALTHHQFKDAKLTHAYKMSDIYCTVALLALLILKQQNAPFKALVNPSLKSVLQHTLESYHYLLDSLTEQYQFDRQFANHILQIENLLSERQYRRDPQRSQKIIAQTHKIKETLKEIIKKQSKYLALFSFHMQDFGKNCPQNIIETVIANPKYKYFAQIKPEEQPQIKERHSHNHVTNHNQFTLFLDLDQTLVHFNQETQQLLIRPYAAIFLKEIVKYYEVIIFTAASQAYADWAIDNLDTERVVKKRLYRQHAILENGMYIKDIVNVGRSLHKSLIVDNLRENFGNQEQNGIHIRSWHEDNKDKVLRDLFPVLKVLALKPSRDIRQEIKRLTKLRKYTIEKQGFQLGSTI